MGRPRQPQICCSSRCLREIQPHEKAVALTCFAQTLGMGKRRTTKSQRLFLCPQCAWRVAGVEKEPSRTAPFDLAIFKVLLDLVGADPDVAPRRAGNSFNAEGRNSSTRRLYPRVR